MVCLHNSFIVLYRTDSNKAKNTLLHLANHLHFGTRKNHLHFKHCKWFGLTKKFWISLKLCGTITKVNEICTRVHSTRFVVYHRLFVGMFRLTYLSSQLNRILSVNQRTIQVNGTCVMWIVSTGYKRWRTATVLGAMSVRIHE